MKSLAREGDSEAGGRVPSTGSLPTGSALMSSTLRATPDTGARHNAHARVGRARWCWRVGSHPPADRGRSVRVPSSIGAVDEHPGRPRADRRQLPHRSADGRFVIARVFGVPIDVTPAWFLVAGLITYGFAPTVERGGPRDRRLAVRRLAGLRPAPVLVRAGPRAEPHARRAAGRAAGPQDQPSPPRRGLGDRATGRHTRPRGRDRRGRACGVTGPGRGRVRRGGAPRAADRGPGARAGSHDQQPGRRRVQHASRAAAGRWTRPVRRGVARHRSPPHRHRGRGLAGPAGWRRWSSSPRS